MTSAVDRSKLRASTVTPRAQRVARVKALGESVKTFEVDEPATPAADELLIDVVAAGIGNWDGVAGADGAIVLSLRT